VLVLALLTDVGLATLAESSRIFSAIRAFGGSAFRCKNVFGDLRHFGFSRYLRARSRYDSVFLWGGGIQSEFPADSFRVAVVGCVVIIVVFFAVAFVFLLFLVRLLSEDDIGTRRGCV
jgi:hypothetical protein